MEQRPIVMNTANMIAATERSKRRVDEILQLARDIETDARQAERV